MKAKELKEWNLLHYFRIEYKTCTFVKKLIGLDLTGSIYIKSGERDYGYGHFQYGSACSLSEDNDGEHHICIKRHS